MVSYEDIKDLNFLLKRSDNFEKISSQIIKTLFMYNQRAEMNQRQILMLSIRQFEDLQKRNLLDYSTLTKLLDDLEHNLYAVNSMRKVA